jgi:riboflavin kinase/FMN adenylyltransferase
VNSGPALLEVHLLDFSGDLYGADMEVEFVERIRDERKFDSLQALVAEMKRDKERAREILSGRIATDSARQPLDLAPTVHLQQN